MLLTHFTIGHAYFLMVTATVTLLLTAAYVAYRITQCTHQRFTWPATVSLNSITIKGIIMKIAIHAGKEVPVVLGKPVKKDGTPAEIQEGSLVIKILDDANLPADDIVSWERDDQAENPDDPYTGKLVWHREGTATLVVNGDADLGEGVETIALEVEVDALAEEAVGFNEPTVGTERDHVQTTEGSEQAS